MFPAVRHSSVTTEDVANKSQTAPNGAHNTTSACNTQAKEFISELCDRIKTEYSSMYAHIQNLKNELDKASNQRADYERNLSMFNVDITHFFTNEVHKMMDIIKRLIQTCIQQVPFLPPEMQASCMQLIDQVKHYTSNELAQTYMPPSLPSNVYPFSGPHGPPPPFPMPPPPHHPMNHMNPGMPPHPGQPPQFQPHPPPHMHQGSQVMPPPNMVPYMPPRMIMPQNYPHDGRDMYFNNFEMFRPPMRQDRDMPPIQGGGVQENCNGTSSIRENNNGNCTVQRNSLNPVCTSAMTTPSIDGKGIQSNEKGSPNNALQPSPIDVAPDNSVICSETQCANRDRVKKDSEAGKETANDSSNETDTERGSGTTKSNEQTSGTENDTQSTNIASPRQAEPNGITSFREEGLKRKYTDNEPFPCKEPITPPRLSSTNLTVQERTPSTANSLTRYPVALPYPNKPPMGNMFYSNRHPMNPPPMMYPPGFQPMPPMNEPPGHHPFPPMGMPPQQPPPPPPPHGFPFSRPPLVPGMPHQMPPNHDGTIHPRLPMNHPHFAPQFGPPLPHQPLPHTGYNPYAQEYPDAMSFTGPFPMVPKTLSCVGTLVHRDVVCSVAFSHPWGLVFTGGKGTVKVWDMNEAYSPRLVSSLDCLNDCYVRGVKTINSNRILLVSGEHTTVGLWSLTMNSVNNSVNLNTITELTNPAPVCYDMVVSPDEKQCFCSLSNGSIVTWDIETTKPIRTYVGHVDGATCLDILKDGSLLYSGGLDAKVYAWDHRDSKPVRSYSFATQVFTISTAPSQDYFVVGLENKTIELYYTRDQSQNGERQIFKIHESCVLTVKISNSGRWLISSSKDNYTNCIKMPQGIPLFVTREANSILCTDISHDDKYVVTGGGEKKATVYECVYP